MFGRKKTNEIKEPNAEYACPACGGKLIQDKNVFICQNCGQAIKKDDVTENRKTEKFQMHIADIFSVRGRGTVITGMVESGMVCKQDILIINGTQYSIGGIEFNRKIIDVATAGMNIGILVRGAQQNEFVKGALVIKKDSI